MRKLQLITAILCSINLYSSDLSEFMGRFQTNVICNLRAVNAVPDVPDRSSNEGSKTSDLVGLLGVLKFLDSFKIFRNRFMLQLSVS